MMLQSEIDAIPVEGDVSYGQRAVEPASTALLLIDLQKVEFNQRKCAAEPHDAYMWNRITETVIPNGRRLLTTCRKAGIEVIYTVIESLTLDGRDRGLDYKISGIFAAKGSWQAEVLDGRSIAVCSKSIPQILRFFFAQKEYSLVGCNRGITFTTRRMVNLALSIADNHLFDDVLLARMPSLSPLPRWNTTLICPQAAPAIARLPL